MKRNRERERDRNPNMSKGETVKRTRQYYGRFV